MKFRKAQKGEDDSKLVKSYDHLFSRSFMRLHKRENDDGKDIIERIREGEGEVIFSDDEGLYDDSDLRSEEEPSDNSGRRPETSDERRRRRRDIEKREKRERGSGGGGSKSSIDRNGGRSE